MPVHNYFAHFVTDTTHYIYGLFYVADMTSLASAVLSDQWHAAHLSSAHSAVPAAAEVRC